MSHRSRNFFILTLMGFTIACFQNCAPSDGTDSGDPGLQLELAPYSETTALLNYFVPKAFADVSAVSMCVHQIRFKMDNQSANPGTNVVIDVDYVEWGSQGTAIGTLLVPHGDYRRIDIMVKNDCLNNQSLSLSNDNGQFSNNQPLILKFHGEITIDQYTDSLSLSVDPFIEFFDSITSDNDLNAGIQNIEGTF